MHLVGSIAEKSVYPVNTSWRDLMLALPIVLVVVVVLVSTLALAAVTPVTTGKMPPKLREIMWVWGNPELTQPGKHTLGTFREASPAERAKLLGVDNIIMAGMALPDDESEGERLTKEASGAKRLVWETRPDGPGIGPPFEYKDRMAQVRRLAEKYPQIEGALLDDMSTGKIDRGFKPEHIREMRRLLSGTPKPMRIWGVTYSMSLDRPGINDYLKEVDVINLWVWDAKDVVNIERYVAKVETQAPGKPIMLGLYLYDYGADREFPPDLLRKQCDIALKLAHAGRIQGIVFLTIHNDPQAVSWAADWIKRVGRQELRTPQWQSLALKPAARSTLPVGSPAYAKGPRETVLRASSTDNSIRIDISRDEGATWEAYSTISKPDTALGTGWFTQLPDGGLLHTVQEVSGNWKGVSWVRSRDYGKTWSPPVRITAIVDGFYPYGPVSVMNDGNWAYCLYFEQMKGDYREMRSMVLWSGDQGKTWSRPITFPTPEDGNKGLTEATVTQAANGEYVAAIRGDEWPGNTDKFDGFYLARSADGINWSPPESLFERMRMPLFYKVGDLWALFYRLYDANEAIQYSALRFSSDGIAWSYPMIIERGVNWGAQLVQVKGKTIVFNHLYPDVTTATRSVLRVPDWVRRQIRGK